MPNWCYNRATIVAESLEAKNLLNDYCSFLSSQKEGEDNKFFDWFYPVPELVDEAMTWRSRNWGTKWDTGLSLSDIHSDTILFNNDTAWSPPVGFYNYMVEMGFSVQASWYEPGVQLLGSYDNAIEYDDVVPRGDETFSLMSSIMEEGNSVNLTTDIDSASPADIIGTLNGESIIFISSSKHSWDEFAQNNEDIFNSSIREWETTIDEICKYETDFCLVEFILDASTPGSLKGFIFEDQPNKLHYKLEDF